MEASGTGNMKFALNGALTIGTLDGANIEIRAAVGAENFFSFGLSADQVAQMKDAGYAPRAIYEATPELKEALDQIKGGFFLPQQPKRFWPLVDTLLDHDPFMLLADYKAYLACQEQVGQVYQQTERWQQMSILNTARMGRFSADRAIREYCEEIWGVKPQKIALPAVGEP
jgi:starch phosphorylase